MEESVSSPRNTVLYGINPLLEGQGQASAPTAAIRIGDYKLLAWGYRIKVSMIQNNIFRNPL